jgi:peptidoglycan/xylan/chitin deacetylase (PgdA/CDA1 family)
MPALVRHLRNKYRLSRASSDGWRKIEIRKRDQPTARILYYHRVNDENDPFFPALSTATFEAQMRFLRKSYRVVGLTELVRRLRDGPAEPVLAITFDDGYRDNYLNAFPILKRYGLPATIFLTTGSMDTGEPIWFERLALGMKNTPRESIDLEFSSLKRISLRTLTERLNANNQLLSVLRRLPDPDRRQFLADILRQVTTRDDGERYWKMLTWDDVRLMSAHDIDFGGHTVTHPFLSRLTSDEFYWEVSECKRRIEDELQLPSEHFAYPSGREEDFGLANKALVRKAGYRAAMTTIWGVNNSSTDPFELRRGGPWEESKALFAYKLDWYELMEE